MNVKKVKQLRKALRAQGVDVNERVYMERGGRKATAGFPGITGTVFLRQGCGRQIYQAMKGQ